MTAAAGARPLPAKRAMVWSLVTAIGALILCTITLVLWFPISEAAVVEADNAGWDTNLLLPHQFILDVVLVGTWLCLLGTVIASALGVRAATKSPRPDLPFQTAPSDLTV
jgi:hypothetical protein